MLEKTGINKLPSIKTAKYIHNIDKKGCRLAYPGGQKIIIPVEINEMYVGIPENRLSLLVIESICTDGLASHPIVIVPSSSIMEHWFHINMIGYELITVSPSKYTTSEISLLWLEHFIKYNKYRPDTYWRILVLNSHTSYIDDNFVTTCKTNNIWLILFPSHQIYLIQPADIECFCTWKYQQHTAIWNAI
jgi:hypothetical protein